MRVRLCVCCVCASVRVRVDVSVRVLPVQTDLQTLVTCAHGAEPLFPAAAASALEVLAKGADGKLTFGRRFERQEQSGASENS